MKRAILLVLLLNYAILVNAQNLVTNPDFETWTKIEKPFGWSTAQNCLKDSISVNSGLYSCKHSGGTSAKYLGQFIPINAGLTYDLSFYYRTETTGTGNGCRLWSYWKDSDGNSISDPLTDDILRPSKYLKSESWQQFSVELLAPANASSLYLEVRTYTNSITWWDDFEFEECIPTKLNEEEDDDILIYPNPAHDLLNIRGTQNGNEITILDLTGRTILVSKQSDNGLISIPLIGLPDGIYMIRYQTSNKVSFKKFIKD